MAQAFVTGGSGFIGQVLVRRLLDEGHSVGVLVRGETSAAKVSALGAKPVRGELTDPSTWRNELTGSDVVFHLAAETDVTADRERHQLVTVRGPRQPSMRPATRRFHGSSTAGAKPRSSPVPRSWTSTRPRRCGPTRKPLTAR